MWIVRLELDISEKAVDLTLMQEAESLLFREDGRTSSYETPGGEIVDCFENKLGFSF